MNYIEKFNKIRDFLSKYEDIYSKEVLNFYPHSLKAYPEDWIDSLEHLEYKDLYQILQNTFKTPNKSFQDFLDEIKELTQMEKINQNQIQQFSKNSFFKIKDKKKHELKALNQEFLILKKQEKLESIIDIGGGVGNLSRFFSTHLKLNCLCIEANENFITLGKKHLNKYPIPEEAGILKFKNGYYPHIDNIKEILQKEKTLSMGLHTCGPLAVEHLTSHVLHAGSYLFNFGCCYHLITDKKHLNISSIAKQKPLDLEMHALTLASRGHNKISEDDYIFSKRVKHYRYALHLFIYHELGYKKFLSVGDGNKKTYKDSFSNYALIKLHELHLDKKISLNLDAKKLDQTLADFIKKDDITKIIKKMYLANIIRWKLGRPLELYIILDRYFYLLENGQNVTLKEYFNDRISPRNLGIFSYKNE